MLDIKSGLHATYGKYVVNYPAPGFLKVKIFQCNDPIMLSIKYILILYGILVCPGQFLHFMSLLIYVECCLFCYLSGNLKEPFVLNIMRREHPEGWSDSFGLLYPFPVLFILTFLNFVV